MVAEHGLWTDRHIFNLAGRVKHQSCGYFNNSKVKTIWVAAAFFLLAFAITVQPPAAASDALNLSADSTRWYTDDRVVARSNVKVVYKEFTVTSDSLEADLATNIAVFTDNVKLLTGGQTASGAQLTLNLKTREWNFTDAKSVMAPDKLGGRVQGSAYIKSREISGTSKETRLESGTLTTCDLENPHYCFSAEKMEIYPGSRIIAYKVSIYGKDKRLVTFERLAIPIRGLSTNLIPQVGSSAEEGMYLKAAYPYMAEENNQGFLKLDLMQLRGIGTGLDHAYQLSEGAGQVSLYYLQDRQLGGTNITGRLQHQHRLGTVNLNLTTDYRTNNYLYYPGTTAQTWQLGLTNLTSKSSTSLAFTGNASQGSGSYKTSVMALRQMQKISPTLTGMLSMNMRSSLIPGGNEDRDLDSSFELKNREEKYDLGFTVTTRSDLSNTDRPGTYSYLERLPELTFDTDSYRIGEKAFFGIPSRISINAGRYHEEPSQATSNRLVLKWDMLNQILDIGEKNQLSCNAGFSQAYYASDQEQYVIRLSSVLTTRQSDYFKTRIMYNMQDVNGYSPFQFDYTGKYHAVRAVAEYQKSNALRWSLASGYDFNNKINPWQDVALRLTAMPNKNLAYFTSIGFSPNTARWNNFVQRARLGSVEGSYFDLGTRYDLTQGRLVNARGIFALHMGRDWKLQGIAGWNAYTNGFDYRAFRLTKDLHCLEATITYTDDVGYRNASGLRFDLKIKAFPTQDLFGIGQYGQAIDTSMGEYNY
jgi:hypothetical protein